MYLKKLSLTLFRGFSSLVEESFAPFTILGGRNNTGKTSLLEAIFYLAHRSFGAVPGQLMLNRKMSLSKHDMSPLFYNLQPDTLDIHSEFSDGSKRGLSLEVANHPMIAVQLAKPDELEDIRNATSPFFEQQWYTQFNNGKESRGVSEVFFTHDEYKVRDVEFKSKTPNGEVSPPKDSWRCFYYQTRSMGNMRSIYKELFQKKKDGVLIDVLHTIDHRIVDVAFDGDQVWVDIGIEDSRIPIEIMGDGSVKAADILALASLAKRGDVLCIDEIENGLHHSFMGPFVKMLAKVVVDRGIQVIATTHNLELMQSVAEQEAQEFCENFSYVNLTRRRDGTIISTSFNHDEFSTNLDNGIDIR